MSTYKYIYIYIYLYLFSIDILIHSVCNPSAAAIRARCPGGCSGQRQPSLGLCSAFWGWQNDHVCIHSYIHIISISRFSLLTSDPPMPNTVALGAAHANVVNPMPQTMRTDR